MSGSVRVRPTGVRTIRISGIDEPVEITNIAGEYVNIEIKKAPTLKIEWTEAQTVNIQNVEATQIDVDIINAPTLTVVFESDQNVAITGPLSAGGNLEIAIIEAPVLTVAFAPTQSVYVETEAGTKLTVIQDTSVDININPAQTVFVETDTGKKIDVDVKTSVNINIKTAAGVNIVLDKLEQPAYKERRIIAQNDENPTAPNAPSNNMTGQTYKGKFFPRGCRGFLRHIIVYCKRTGAGTITISFSPHPSMGAIGSVTITPTATWAWTGADYNKFWNYDSLFMWTSACDVDVSFGYDTGTPYDEYHSADSGVTWAIGNARLHIRTYIDGLTVGDLPVSGTINTVKLPNASTEATLGLTGVETGVETVLATVVGSGKSVHINFEVWHELCSCRVYIDGVQVFNRSPNSLNAQGFVANTEGIAVTTYAAGAVKNNLSITLPFEFTQSLEVRGFQTTGGNINMACMIIANTIR